VTRESGYRLVSPLEARFHETKMSAPMRFQCTLCDAHTEGTAGDVLEFAARHRRAVHPELRDRGQKARQQAGRDAARTRPRSEPSWA
jgi:hypothetical protein